MFLHAWDVSVCFEIVECFSPLSATYNLQQTKIANLAAFSKNKEGMMFHEDRLLADGSHVISYLIFLEIGKDVAKFAVCCSHDWHFKG